MKGGELAHIYGGLYCYAGNNPVRYTDPDGREKVSTIGEISGYPETGDTAWRKDNDQVFIAACSAYNSKYKLSEGDDGFVSPKMLKAQAMVESGGVNDKNAFLSDPLQVNNPGDWDSRKEDICGLAKNQKMTPEISAAAALEWRRYKGYIHDENGKEQEWRGDWEANRRYNGNTNPAPDGTDKQHRDWYASKIEELSK